MTNTARRIRVLLLAAATSGVMSIAASALAGEPVLTRGAVDAVTVYRGQALVTRLVPVEAGAGLVEVVVTDLPGQIQPGSLFAEPDAGVEVRSVRYRERPVSQDVREEVRAIDAQMKEISQEIDAVNRRVSLLTQRREYLTKLEGFVAPTANAELSRGVLDAETLKEITSFVFAERTSITEEELKFDRSLVGLNERLALLRQERDTITAGSSRTAREAVVFLNVLDGGGAFRLRYLVNNATWEPSYNLRATRDTDSVAVEYHASIRQTSGEDWTDVEMRLSTATPSLNAKAPSLTPLTLMLGSDPSAPGQQQQSEVQYKASKQTLVEQRRQVENDRAFGNRADDRGQQRGAIAGVQNDAWDATLNMIACQDQLLDLALRSDGSGTTGRIVTTVPSTEGLSVTYLVPSRTSMPSRNDLQQIQIASIPMAADFYKVAIPVLTESVYNEAELANGSGYVLLAGPVAAYLDGEFVGSAELPNVTTGESFTVGFGIDTSLRAQRVLASKTETVQGGNRLTTLSYKLTIQNFNTHAAEVRLLDRLPNPKTEDVRLTLVNPGLPLSTDADYLATDRKSGILRWDVPVPIGAGPTISTSFEYSFRLEHDKQMGVTALAADSR